MTDRLRLFPLLVIALFGAIPVGAVSVVRADLPAATEYQDSDSASPMALDATEDDTPPRNVEAEAVLPPEGLSPPEGQAASPSVPGPSYHGFLPTRGSVMLDFVFLAMLLILPVLKFSVMQARARRIALHRNLQVGTAIALLVAVVLFEVDMRFYTNWRLLAEPSPLYAWCVPLLAVHLLFAVPTPFLWGWVIYGALRNFDRDFQGPYLAQHRLAGRIAAWMMYATGLTGILFYVVAFVI